MFKLQNSLFINLILPLCFTSHLLLHVMPDVFILCSEFEEHDQVSTINESAIETSSAAVAATDAVEDSVFTNFFNVCFLVVYRFSCLFAEYLCNVNFKFGFSFYDFMMSLALETFDFNCCRHVRLLDLMLQM